jgi:hypothetical protein
MAEIKKNTRTATVGGMRMYRYSMPSFTVGLLSVSSSGSSGAFIKMFDSEPVSVYVLPRQRIDPGNCESDQYPGHQTNAYLEKPGSIVVTAHAKKSGHDHHDREHGRSKQYRPKYPTEDGFEARAIWYLLTECWRRGQ